MKNNKIQKILNVSCCLICIIGFKTYSSVEEINENVDIDFIRTTLSKQRDMLNKAYNQEITVFMGNTGAGKSTLVNLLAEVPLKIDSHAHIVADANGCKIASGTHSITKYPTFLKTKLGMAWDCPGFNDTDGALHDVLAASLIHELLTKASAVKVVFVTSVPEIEGARGAMFKSLLKTINMFEKKFVNSCLIVINKLDGDIIDQPDWLESILEKEEISNLKLLSNDIIPIRKTRVHNTIDILYSDRDKLTRALHLTKGQATSSINLSLAFGVKTGNTLTNFFTFLARETLEECSSKIYQEAIGFLPMTSKNIYIRHNACWETLQTFVKCNQDYQLLQPIAEEQAERALINFKGTFIKEHARYTQELQIKEQEEIIKKREEEIKKLADERQRNEKRAIEENLKAEKLKQEIDLARKNEKHALGEAEKIRQLSSQNEKDKAEALKHVNEATLRKNQLEQQAENQRVLIQKTEQERQRSIDQLSSAMKNLEYKEQQFQKERDSTNQRFEQQLQNLRAQNSSLNSQLGQISLLQNQLNQFRNQIATITPHIHATNQRIAERNNRIAQRGGHRGHHHGHQRVAWPLIPWQW